MPRHEALSDAGPSLIELWELQLPDAKQDIEGWRAPFDGLSQTSPEVRLVKRNHDGIKALVVSVSEALKHASIPVAGADRLKLTEHIAIIDLMNLADAVLLPQDDLALAVALKSPLFGLSEDDLFKLAWQRKGSLRGALSLHAATDGKFRDTVGRLEKCERRFATETPFAFYAWLLGGDGGRKRIL